MSSSRPIRRRAALLQYGLCCGFCKLKCLVVIVGPMRRKPRNGRENSSRENPGFRYLRYMLGAKLS